MNIIRWVRNNKHLKSNKNQNEDKIKKSEFCPNIVKDLNFKSKYYELEEGDFSDCSESCESENWWSSRKYLFLQYKQSIKMTNFIII